MKRTLLMLLLVLAACADRIPMSPSDRAAQMLYECVTSCPADRYRQIDRCAVDYKERRALAMALEDKAWRQAYGITNAEAPTP